MSKHNDDCAGRNGAPAHGKHTPGPWVVGYQGAGARRVCVYSGRTLVAEAIGSPRANARLIAAAPELLEALRAIKKIVDDAAERPTGFLVADFQTATYPNSRDAYSALCAAIAKAEGRS